MLLVAQGYVGNLDLVVLSSCTASTYSRQSWGEPHNRKRTAKNMGSTSTCVFDGFEDGFPIRKVKAELFSLQALL